ncbi:hypothetical protein LGQ02_19805 [Bacillus shivajii]|uniref:hypothetical protein n=1 Tax=Bacillus shivajii TaxID=1983719 RepID=UPI001CFBDDA2|nr:hypothetical protein [Bacillus shivajii]UCZ52998.1 hypothetical protein LGQ02_19805 [Bacillus shivajii]
MKKKTFLTAASTVLALGILGACADQDIDVDDGFDGNGVEEDGGDDAEVDVEVDDDE